MSSRVNDSNSCVSDSLYLFYNRSNNSCRVHSYRISVSVLVVTAT